MTDLKNAALGLLETRGLVAAIEAADAMLKTADVRLLAREQTIPALITIEIIGEVAAVRAAVEAGKQAAERVGEVVSAHVIPRPDTETWPLLEHYVPFNKATPPSITPEELEQLTVTQLRALARKWPDFPLKGRAIARANRQQLLDAFMKILSSS